MKFKTAYSKPMATRIDFSDQKSLTEQCHAGECEINNILAKYQKTGVLQHRNDHEAQYDFCSGQDFQDSMEIIAKASSMFEDLPSTLRTKFENDPAKFLNFVQNEDNVDEMVKLGLALPPEGPPEPLEVRVVPDPSPPSENGSVPSEFDPSD